MWSHQTRSDGIKNAQKIILFPTSKQGENLPWGKLIAVINVSFEWSSGLRAYELWAGFCLWVCLLKTKRFHFGKAEKCPTHASSGLKVAFAKSVVTLWPRRVARSCSKNRFQSHKTSLKNAIYTQNKQKKQKTNNYNYKKTNWLRNLFNNRPTAFILADLMTVSWKQKHPKAFMKQLRGLATLHFAICDISSTRYGLSGVIA